MSRLIIKNVPAYHTEETLRKLFTKFGTVTDCSLKYSKGDNKFFRTFAFVGFDQDDACKKAISELNNTYMGTYKVTVEACEALNKRKVVNKDKDKKKKNDESAEEPKTTKKEDKKAEEKQKPVDADFQRYLQAKGETVTTTPTPTLSGTSGAQIPSVNKKAVNEDSLLIDELMADWIGDTDMSLIFSNLPPTTKGNSIKDFLSPLKFKALKFVRNDKESCCLVTFLEVQDLKRALRRDKNYLKGKAINIRHAKPALTSKDVIMLKKMAPVPPKQEEEDIRDKILDTGRIFLRNLAFNTTEDDIRLHFKKFGEISEVQVIIDKASGKCKGFAIVEFMFPEAAVAAYAACDGQVFKGRLMHILPGQEKKKQEEKDNKAGETEDGRKKSFKKEKLEKLKAGANKAVHSWNALFLGPNAVADTLAEKLGVSKSDLLMDENSESTGVRMALAETRLVRETRDFLVSNGVCLDAFSRPSSKRSTKAILVKNLPAGVTEEELRLMFERHGQCDKVLLPKDSAVTAIVVMGNSVDAKKAFKSLAYSRFRTKPLFLEWAPGDIFGDSEQQGEVVEAEEPTATVPVEQKRKRKDQVIADLVLGDTKKRRKAKELEAKQDVAVVEKTDDSEDVKTETGVEGLKKDVDEWIQGLKGEIDEEEEQGEPMETGEEGEQQGIVKKEAVEEGDDDFEVEPGATVFVKNVNFNTTDEQLAKLFTRMKYRFKSAKISKKLNPTEPEKSLSMGFGFVQFYTKAEAERAVKEMQGCLLHGHSLQMKLSHREVEEDPSHKRKTVDNLDQGKCTKIMVRNIPFQASVKEVESLFSSFGEVKSVRIPKKIGSDQHRGFGFIDFMSIGDAKMAFESLVHSTHLYGRRLVVEWAKEESKEDEVKKLRKKTNMRYTGGEKSQTRLRKLEMDLQRKVFSAAEVPLPREVGKKDE